MFFYFFCVINRYDDYIYWLYTVIIMFVSEIVVIYTVFLIYPFWTSNKGYFVPALKYMGFYINFDNDSFELPMEDHSSEERRLYNADTVFPVNHEPKN